MAKSRQIWSHRLGIIRRLFLDSHLTSFNKSECFISENQLYSKICRVLFKGNYKERKEVFCCDLDHQRQQSLFLDLADGHRKGADMSFKGIGSVLH